MTSWLSSFVFSYNRRDSRSSGLRWSRPSRQPGRSWTTRTPRRSWETGQARASRGLWCFHVLSVQLKGKLQQRAQHLMTHCGSVGKAAFDLNTTNVLREQFTVTLICRDVYSWWLFCDNVCLKNSCTAGRNNLISWIKLKHVRH